MTIEYYKKNVYGNELMYIKDTATAEIVRRLTGQKTLSQSAIEALTALGCKFIQVLP